jgi:glycosyltransferase involved in cell wall biosynthesis
MHVTYLTIEDVGSGLFQTQILDLLEEILNQIPNIRIEVLIINRPWYILSHLRHLNKIKQKLNNDSIKLIYVPLLPPLRGALKSYFYSVLVTHLLRLLFSILVSNKTWLFHCRSYWTAQAALKIRKGPVLFDMRSLWPAENVSIGNLREKSRSFEYWMNLERKCLESACVSTGVSKAMIDYAKAIAPYKRIELIPISVDMEKFKFSATNRLKKRKFLSWSENTILVYSGSFGMSNINYFALGSLLSLLIASHVNVRLLFLTMETEEKVHALMKNILVDRSRFHLIHPTNDDMAAWLSAADIGVHALPKQLDSATRLGTKVVEYWATGLPVIVNENVGAAAEFIREYKVGAVLNTGLENDLETISTLVESLSKKRRQEQIDFARKQFSTAVVAKKYINAYTFCNRYGRLTGR